MVKLYTQSIRESEEEAMIVCHTQNSCKITTFSCISLGYYYTIYSLELSLRLFISFYAMQPQISYTLEEVQSLVQFVLAIQWAITKMDNQALQRVQEAEEKKKAELTKVAEQIAPKKKVKN